MDKEEKILIPKNNKDFFEIKKSKNWKYCIDIKIKKNEIIFKENLYNIIISYINNEIYLVTQIALIISIEDKEIIVNKIWSYKIKNMTIDNFILWLDNEFKESWKYEENEKELLGIRIVFNKKIIEIKNTEENTEVLNFLKPIFPWKNNFIKITDNKDETIKLKNKIKYLKKIIKVLKKNKYKYLKNI